MLEIKKRMKTRSTRKIVVSAALVTVRAALDGDELFLSNKTQTISVKTKKERERQGKKHETKESVCVCER